MSCLKAWWGQPDQYDWLTSFLRQRGTLRLARTIMAVVAFAAGLVALSDLFSQRRLTTPAVAVDTVTFTYALVMAVSWMVGWPTRRQSLVAVVVGVLCIGGWGLAQPNAAIGALACTTTAVTGGYSAVFHGPRLLVLHSMLAVAIAAAAALRLARHTGIPVLSAFWLINFVTLSVPLGFWGMSRGLQMYAHRSEQDALTGLLNRRALTDAVGHRLSNPPPAHTRMAIMMIDLDNFKSVNDTEGHPAGDDALRNVAKLLREHTPADAIICRAGGEEFLIALTTESSEVGALGARICTAIDGLSPKITASIGIASAELHSLTGPAGARLVEELIGIADQAMYAAKRNGGNQAQHA